MDKVIQGTVGPDELRRLSDFRCELRRFLRLSEDICRTAGVSMLQYQLLLHTQAFEDRDWASIGEIAARLHAQPHGVVALVDRAEESGLVRRRASAVDRRVVEVHLTSKGRRLLQRLALTHREELVRLAAVVEALGQAKR